MEHHHGIMLVAFVALASVILWKREPPPVHVAAPEPNAMDTAGASNAPTNSRASRGPKYLTYNAPWRFAPPVALMRPNVAGKFA